MHLTVPLLDLFLCFLPLTSNMRQGKSTLSRWRSRRLPQQPLPSPGGAIKSEKGECQARGGWGYRTEQTEVSSGKEGGGRASAGATGRAGRWCYNPQRRSLKAVNVQKCQQQVVPREQRDHNLKDRGLKKTCCISFSGLKYMYKDLISSLIWIMIYLFLL